MSRTVGPLERGALLVTGSRVDNYFGCKLHLPPITALLIPGCFNKYDTKCALLHVAFYRECRLRWVAASRNLPNVLIPQLILNGYSDRIHEWTGMMVPRNVSHWQHTDHVFYWVKQAFYWPFRRHYDRLPKNEQYALWLSAWIFAPLVFIGELYVIYWWVKRYYWTDSSMKALTQAYERSKGRHVNRMGTTVSQHDSVSIGPDPDFPNNPEIVKVTNIKKQHEQNVTISLAHYLANYTKDWKCGSGQIMIQVAARWFDTHHPDTNPDHRSHITLDAFKLVDSNTEEQTLFNIYTRERTDAGLTA